MDPYLDKIFDQAAEQGRATIPVASKLKDIWDRVAHKFNDDESFIATVNASGGADRLPEEFYKKTVFIVAKKEDAFVSVRESQDGLFDITISGEDARTGRHEKDVVEALGYFYGRYAKPPKP